MEKVVNNNVDIVTPIVDYINKLGDFAKIGIAWFWDEIEEYLTDVPKVYETIVTNRPDLKEIFDTPQGRMWLNSTIKRLYNELWKINKEGLCLLGKYTSSLTK